MRDFKTLDIWKRGISLSKMIYVLSREFPAEENSVSNLKSEERQHPFLSI